MRKCSAILERLWISPHECLETFVQENDIVDDIQEDEENIKGDVSRVDVDE